MWVRFCGTPCRFLWNCHACWDIIGTGTPLGRRGTNVHNNVPSLPTSIENRLWKAIKSTSTAFIFYHCITIERTRKNVSPPIPFNAHIHTHKKITQCQQDLSCYLPDFHLSSSAKWGLLVGRDLYCLGVSWQICGIVMILLLWVSVDMGDFGFFNVVIFNRNSKFCHIYLFSIIT